MSDRAIAMIGALRQEYEERFRGLQRQLDTVMRPFNISQVGRELIEAQTVAAQRTLLEVMPVGSVFIAVVDTDPADLLGYGTWEAFGAGRVIVGYDSGDTDFDTAEETGGEKTHTLTSAEMPAHTHTQRVTATLGAGTSGTRGVNVVDDSDGGQTGSTGGGGAHNNMPPYIVCYLWKRTG